MADQIVDLADVCQQLHTDLTKARKRIQNQRRELRRLNAQIKHTWPAILYGTKLADATRVRAAMIDKFGGTVVLEALADYDKRENEKAKE